MRKAVANVTANEGDSRDYTGYTEEVRVAAANIDAAFPNRTAFRDNNGAGRLTVTTATGDKDGDGDLDEVHVLGARSFSVWQVTGGAGGGVTLAYDSANDLEIRTAAPE
ncbi:alkaline phosphatase-like protein, partial [Monoraphidium neglectum]